MEGGIPPHCRNQRVATAWVTPAIAAASSLVCPYAIAFQNGHRSARCRAAGLPGDRSLSRSDRFALNFFCFINTSVLDVSRRRLEFTQYGQGLSKEVEGARHHCIGEPQGRLLGQRSHEIGQRHLEGRVRQRRALRDAREGMPSDRRIHRLLQHRAAPLVAR